MYLLLVHEFLTKISWQCVISNKLPRKIVRTIFYLSIIGKNIISICTRILLDNTVQLIVDQMKDVFSVWPSLCNDGQSIETYYLLNSHTIIETYIHILSILNHYFMYIHFVCFSNLHRYIVYWRFSSSCYRHTISLLY